MDAKLIKKMALDKLLKETIRKRKRGKRRPYLKAYIMEPHHS